MVTVRSWGRLTSEEHAVRALHDRTLVAPTLSGMRPGIAHGMGRSYGDACLNPGGTLWLTRGLGRFIHFDQGSGRLVCEAGVLLRDIQRLVVPRGWMLPVTPGTQFVTVGGAIANDVHGKNHHVFGSFGDHVQAITLLRTDGETVDCGPHRNQPYFAATVGGIGLTGLILQAEIQLRQVAGPWLDTEKIPYRDLDEFFALADASEKDWEYTVSWVDCLSGANTRGLFMRGNHCDAAQGPLPPKRSRTVPLTPPLSPVNRWTLQALNTAYFHVGKWTAGRALSHYEPFFYPLDNLLEWNRVYGPRGFYQYQCVVPREQGKEAIQAILDSISSAGSGSFLAVLKTFGNRAASGLLSFPQPGVTLALDFPNDGARTEALFERLDAIVAQAGGRIYLAKDARMPRRLFEAGYPALSAFLQHRDPGMSSAMSRRLMDA